MVETKTTMQMMVIVKAIRIVAVIRQFLEFDRIYTLNKVTTFYCFTNLYRPARNALVHRMQDKRKHEELYKFQNNEHAADYLSVDNTRKERVASKRTFVQYPSLTS